MTQKELLYLEDAIGHERIIISSIESFIDELQNPTLIDYMNQELKTHQKMLKNTLKLMEDNTNE